MKLKKKKNLQKINDLEKKTSDRLDRSRKKNETT